MSQRQMGDFIYCTDNIGHKTQNDDIHNRNTTQKTKKMSDTDSWRCVLNITLCDKVCQ